MDEERWLAATDTDDDRPWEMPGQVRRDCAPHRGPFLANLGRACGLGAVASMFLPPLVLLCVPLGVWVWWNARADLGKMRAGEMDPSGRDKTVEARWNSAVGVAVSLGAVGVWAVLLCPGLIPPVRYLLPM